VRALYEGIVPHLVSRICFSGAGGFAHGRFTVSPRVRFLKRLRSSSSTVERGIVHTKHEPLCSRQYGRLHILCGESLCSEWAQVLKLGTTSLIVAMIDRGLIDTRPLFPRNALLAMNVFARDTTCTARVELAGGKKMSAVEIQRSLLDLVVQRLETDELPEWASALCGYWARALDVLEHEPEAASTAFDWAIKLELFRRHSGKRTVRANPVLCEIDYRFSELGGGGIFRALDEAGVLSHRVTEVGDPTGRELEPPRSGRARLRGQLIEFLQPCAHEYRGTWDRIVACERDEGVHLGDPFVQRIEDVGIGPIMRLW
ncbi:MAG: hypothetical protein D6815_07955, partial [Candidatus Dadabacteria bacterium]